MIEMRLNQSCAGETFQNTLHITGQDATAVNADAIATALRNAWNNSIIAKITNAWSLNSIQYREYPSPPNAPFLTAVVPTLPLQGESQDLYMLATHTAMRVNLLSNVAPPYSGTMFIGGWNSDQITTTGEWRITTLAVAVLLGNELLNLGTATGLDIAVGIRSRGTASVAADTTSVVTAFEAVANPASLDSRRKNQGI